MDVRRVALQALLHIERGGDPAPGRVLLRHRRAKQRQDPVACELVHTAAVTFNRLLHTLEAALHDVVGRFFAELFRHGRVTDGVGEQDGYGPALALLGAPGRCARLLRGRGRFGAQGLAAVVAELRSRAALRSARGTGRRERGTAGLTEFGFVTVFMPAGTALHRSAPSLAR